MNAWLPQASYPCGNFSDTSSLKFPKTKGSIGHAFTVCIHTENQNQVSFYPFVLHEISVLIELTLGHLCYLLTDVPPQPNSPPDLVLKEGRRKSQGTSGLKPKMVLICGDLETQGKRIARPQREPTNTSPVSFNKQKNDQSSGISRPLHTQLPPMLHLWCSFTRSD